MQVDKEMGISNRDLIGSGKKLALALYGEERRKSLRSRSNKPVETKKSPPPKKADVTKTTETKKKQV